MFFGGKELILFEGVVEDRKDPLFLGRVRVRAIGFHDQDKQKVPTDTLPWAMPLLPADDGRNVVGYKEGDFVAGYFRDGEAKQFPIILGKIPGIPEKPADPEVGFNDPTPDSMLTPSEVPRPPEMFPPPKPEAEAGQSGVAGSQYSDPNELPVQLTATGQLLKEFGIEPFPYDFNGDGQFDMSDVVRIIEMGLNSFFGSEFTGELLDGINNFLGDQVGEVLNQIVGGLVLAPGQTTADALGLALGNVNGSLAPQNGEVFNEILVGLNTFIGGGLTDENLSTINGTLGPEVGTALNEIFTGINSFLGPEVSGQILSTVGATVGPRVNGQILNSLNLLVGQQTASQILNQIAPPTGQANSLFFSQLVGTVHSTLGARVTGQLIGKLYSSLGPDVTGQLFAAVDSLMTPGVVGEITTAMNDLLGPEVVGQISDVVNSVASLGSGALFGQIVAGMNSVLGPEAGEILDQIFTEISDVLGPEASYALNQILDGVGSFLGPEAGRIINEIFNGLDLFLGAGMPSRTQDGLLGSVQPSRYPLEHQLKESTASRLARHENIDGTLVARKKKGAFTSPTASHDPSGVGTDQGLDSESLGEPETPYDAKYPYNHVYESESGHVIEYDDTPEAERLHFFHRSGTFKEIHPDGTQVDKAVSDRWDLSLGSSNYMAKKDVNITGQELLKLLGKKGINIQSGDVLNEDSHGDRTITVGGNANTLVKKNAYTVIEGDVRILIKGSLYVAVDGDIKIKSGEDFLVEADNTKLDAKRQNILDAGVCNSTSGPLTFLGTAYTDGTFIRSHLTDEALISQALGPVTEIPHIPFIPDLTNENDADDTSELLKPATPKEGYLLNEYSMIQGTPLPGDLYKAASDSDGNLVILSKALGQQPRIYEALPIPLLQDADIKFRHQGGKITTWKVKRPGHQKGKLVAAGRYSGNGNGGRDHWRFDMPGAALPSPCVMQIGTREYLIIESKMRHEVLGV